MAQSSTMMHTFTRVLRARVVEVLLLSVYLAWVFILLLNNAFFASIESIPTAVAAFGTVLGIVILCVTVFGFAFSRKRKPIRTKTILLAAYGTAAVSSLIAALQSITMIRGLGPLSVIAVFTAVSLTLFSFACLSLYEPLSLAEKLAFHILTLLMSLVFFTVCVALLKGASLLFVLTAALALASTAIAIDKPRKLYGAFDKASRLPSPSKTPDRSSVLKINGGETLPHRMRIRSTISFTLIFFVCGFLSAYELNTMQKTTHFAGILTDTFVVGQTSLASILFIALLVVLLVIVLAELIKPNLLLAGITFSLILICTYYCLPVMANISFPVSFILIQAIAFTLLSVALLLFVESKQSNTSVRTTILDFAAELAILAFGGLCGTALALLLMRQFDSIAYRDQLFSLLPAVLIFCVLALVLVFHKDMLSLVRKKTFDRKLDTSQMEHRCQLISETYELTKRESEVLLFLSMGRNVPGIAEALFISPATAKTHVLHIYKKTGVSSRQELLDLLYSSGENPL